ncbi:hypothetical protein OC835_005385 [Tilletia horrida]|nr:hypothetical protein OC835_005385 [Tilletia horrida]
MGWSVDALPAPPGIRRAPATATPKPGSPTTTHEAGPLRTTSFHGAGLAVLRADDNDNDIDHDHVRQPPKKVEPEAGEAVDSGSGSKSAERISPHAPRRAIFSHLEYAFPLKLLHARTSSHNASAQIHNRNKNKGKDTKSNGVAALYIVSYGGGLVSGDDVSLDLDIGPRCTLLTLTQGSTKVFKMRAPSASPGTGAPVEGWTAQTLRYLVRPHATLLVLPDPVTPYSAARYAQTQRFDLRDAARCSCVVLDWFTPGRVHYAASSSPSSSLRSAGELWDFAAYSSRNEFRIGGHVVARDVLLLENPLFASGDEYGGGDDDEEEEERAKRPRPNALAHAMHPYTAYGTLFLYAPPSTSPPNDSEGEEAHTPAAAAAAAHTAIRTLAAELRAEFTSLEQRRVRRSTPSSSPWTTQAPGARAQQEAFSAETVLWPGQDGRGARGGIVAAGAEAGHVLWSLSDIPFPPHSSSSSSSSSSSKNQHHLTILRLAGTTTEAVRLWLALRLRELEDVVGPDLYRTALVA